MLSKKIKFSKDEQLEFRNKNEFEIRKLLFKKIKEKGEKNE